MYNIHGYVDKTYDQFLEMVKKAYWKVRRIPSRGLGLRHSYVHASAAYVLIKAYSEEIWQELGKSNRWRDGFIAGFEETSHISGGWLPHSFVSKKVFGSGHRFVGNTMYDYKGDAEQATLEDIVQGMREIAHQDFADGFEWGMKISKDIFMWRESPVCDDLLEEDKIADHFHVIEKYPHIKKHYEDEQ